MPGFFFILDESLVRAFGRIKFKVRIIPKSSCYGIKFYVVTYPVTTYVLKLIFFSPGSIWFIVQPLMLNIKQWYGWLHPFLKHSQGPMVQYTSIGLHIDILTKRTLLYVALWYGYV